MPYRRVKVHRGDEDTPIGKFIERTRTTGDQLWGKLSRKYRHDLLHFDELPEYVIIELLGACHMHITPHSFNLHLYS